MLFIRWINYFRTENSDEYTRIYNLHYNKLMWIYIQLTESSVNRGQLIQWPAKMNVFDTCSNQYSKPVLCSVTIRDPNSTFQSYTSHSYLDRWNLIKCCQITDKGSKKEALRINLYFLSNCLDFISTRDQQLHCYCLRPWSPIQISHFQKIDWLSMVLRLHQHNIGYTADGRLSKTL